jgi:hypothetical protein
VLLAAIKPFCNANEFFQHRDGATKSVDRSSGFAKKILELLAAIKPSCNV